MKIFLEVALQPFRLLSASGCVRTYPLRSHVRCAHYSFQWRTFGPTLKTDEYLDGPEMRECFPGGPKWFPRDPNHRDPPYTATKLLRVERIQLKMWTRPYYEKKVMQDLGLLGRCGDVVVLKNIPKVLEKLWVVKHLVRIDPIQMPEKLPLASDGSIPRGARLSLTGRLKIPMDVVGETDPVAQSKQEHLKISFEESLKTERRKSRYQAEHKRHWYMPFLWQSHR